MITIFRIVAFENGERRAVLRSVNLEPGGRPLDDDSEVGDRAIGGIVFSTRAQADAVITACKLIKPSLDLRSEAFTPSDGTIIPKEET